MKKIAVFICFIMLFSLCACRDKSGIQTGSASNTVNGWPVVEKADMPSVSTGSKMTVDEIEKSYRPYTDYRIFEIRTKESDIKPSDNGQAYYVSPDGDDANDGKTPETAIKTLRAIGKFKLGRGDVVYLQRGGVWRENIIASTDGVSYSAYGDGKKPEVLSSPMNAASGELWEETETENVYRFTGRKMGDVGTLVLDDDTFTEKCYWEPRDLKSKKPSDLKKDLSFMMYKNELYLYCEKGNPGEIYKSIEICIAASAFSVKANDITIDNICFKYSGNHCVCGTDISGLTLQNCELGYVGGCVQGGLGSGVRYGNAIEIWGTAIDFTVKNNYFYQVYDTAASFQFRGGNDPKTVKNVHFTDNVFEYCTSCIEYWLPKEYGSIDGFYVENNLMWYSGKGRGAVRTGRSGTISLTSGGFDNIMTGDFTVKNNLFAMSVVDLIYITPKRETDFPTADGNTFIQTENGRFGYYGKKNSEVIRFDENIIDFIENTVGDKNATVVFAQE